jgi:hypothetical protein
MEQKGLIKPRAPTRWATDISKILTLVKGPDHFPISVPEVAIDLSKRWFPDNPLTVVHGEHLPGFDGALLPRHDGWGILYNKSITSPGRINFTLAHEFGHYLVHRLKYPDGFKCRQQDVVRWDSEYGQMEHEANTFAAYLLMPLHDFRAQVPASDVATFESLSHCAERYRVSLIAATLRWLSYTERRAVLVVSRDGFVLWARSSKSALKTGAFIRTSGVPPIPVPSRSATNLPHEQVLSRLPVEHEAGVWFTDPCKETALISENYDFSLSLLQLAPSSGYRVPLGDGDDDEPESMDDQIRRLHGLS